MIFQTFHENRHYRIDRFHGNNTNLIKIQKFTLVINFVIFPQNDNLGFKIKVLKFWEFSLDMTRISEKAETSYQKRVEWTVRTDTVLEG